MKITSGFLLTLIPAMTIANLVVMHSTGLANQVSPVTSQECDLRVTQKDNPTLTSEDLQQLNLYTNSPQELQQKAQKITVRVTSTNNGGSGVLIAKKGSTYLVLTNRHVAKKADRFQIQTPDGQKHLAKLITNSGFDPKYDLALLQFTSTQKYELADLKEVKPIYEGGKICSTGFPFDSDRLRFSTGKVSQLSDIPLDDGTQIGYGIDRNSKDIKQGMSGGPILNAQGQVIGINTIGSYPILPSYTYFDGSKPTPKRAAKYQQANWGVPVYNLLTQLDSNILYGYDNLPKVQRQVTPTGYMAKLNRETRQQTVRIEAGGENGSGVIVAKQGNTYYVLTAKHVVEDKPNVRVIAHDQESYQIQPSEVKLAKGLDLAIVKFTSQTNYLVAKIGNYSPARTTSTVFVGGYPGRQNIDSPVWQWQLNPGLIADKEQGKFEAQDKGSFSNGYDLIYTSITYGGMSGGPVFDTDGRVIGIHGRAEGTKSAIVGSSLGISIQTFSGISNQLQVPKPIGVSTTQAAILNPVDLKTVIAIRDNIVRPSDESSGEQWLQYGNQLYRIKKPSDATLAFDKAITKGREYQLLGNYGKALTLALLGKNNSQALTAISAAIAAVPSKERAKYYYLWKYQSGIFGGLGKYDDALRSIETAIKLEPSDLNLLNEKATILIKNKRYREAIAIYDSIIPKQPESFIHSNRGVAKSALGQKQAAITDYDLAIAINPNYSLAYYNRGLVKSELGQKQAAISDYDRAIAINPNEAKFYINRGVAKAKLGQKQAAISDYDRAIAINPNEALVYYNRGNAKSDLGQKQAAVSDYDRAIAINPNDAETYNNRGLAKSALGQKQAAIGDYDRAIAINPNNATAYSNRGDDKSELGQKQAAISDFDRAIAIDPNFAKAYLGRGVTKSELGQKQAAISDFDRGIAINPNDTKAYLVRGITKSELGQKQAAISDFDRAIAIDPNDTKAYLVRGITKLELGQKQAAINDFDRVIAIDPNFIKAYISRGIIKSDLGQKQAAIVDLAKAADLCRQQNQMDLYQKIIGLIKQLQK